MSFKLLMEGWRGFVDEQEAQPAAAGAEGGEDSGPMQSLLGQEYTQFVKWLGNNIQDPKTQAIITAGIASRDGDAKDDVFGFQNAPIPVQDLRPTQSEIDIDKSLAYPLAKDPAQFIEKVVSNGPFTVVEPIITYNGKYVIDGHHRWSTVYACNKNASINAVNLTMAGMDPLDVLKAVQMAIGAAKKEIPVQSVEGTNLLKVQGPQLAEWIKKTATPELLQLIDQSDKAKAALSAVGTGDAAVNEIFGLGSAEKMDKAVAASGEDLQARQSSALVGPLVKYIMANVAQMQETSQPVPGAGPRDFMPQTGDVNWKEPLAKGMIDVKPPFGKVAESIQDIIDQEIIKILKGKKK